MRRLGLYLIVLLLWGSPALAAIALDGTCTVSGGSGDFGDDTFAHTTGGSANLLTVCTHTDGGTDSVDDIAGITHNGDTVTALLNAEAAGGQARTELWYRLAPDLGALNVVVNATNNPYFVYVACSFSGVVQAAPTHTQTATSFVATISTTVTSATDELVLACATINPLPVTITEGAGETERWHTGHNTVHAFGSTMDGAAPNVTPDLTFDDNYLSSQVVVSFAPLAVAAGRRFSAPILYP